MMGATQTIVVIISIYILKKTDYRVGPVIIVQLVKKHLIYPK